MLGMIPRGNPADVLADLLDPAVRPPDHQGEVAGGGQGQSPRGEVEQAQAQGDELFLDRRGAEQVVERRRGAPKELPLVRTQ